MAYSEIFDNYIKIALEKGIIKEAEETNPRFDSKTVKDIENLYNLKIERPADMEYEHNIVEDAHPEPVVFFQSHDKINSLVENVNERQNIIVNILKKMPNGNLTQKKYAEELTMSLIRVATTMDLKNQVELMALADTCAEQLAKKADWKDMLSERAEDAKDVGGGALVGGALGALIGIFGGPVGIGAGAMGGAALGGALSAIIKTSPQAKNVVINANIAKEELADLIKDFPTDTFLQSLDAALSHITETASKYSQTIDSMRGAGAKVSPAEVQTVCRTYMDELNKLGGLMKTFMANAGEGKYAPDDSDWLSKVKNVGTSLFGDDVSDETKALETLQRVIAETQKGIRLAMSESQKLHEDAPAPEASAPASSGIDLSKYTPEQIDQLLAQIKKTKGIDL